ncbi:MAG: hypothetical protein AAF585_25955 [Verrucomicrobiota bacterium]
MNRLPASLLRIQQRRSFGHFLSAGRDMIVIDPDGTIAFAGANGPWGFRPLRTSVYLDMGKGLPYVPKDHERHCLEAFLDRKLGTDLVSADAMSGKTVA